MSGSSFYVDPSVAVGLILVDFPIEPMLPLVANGSLLAYSDFALGEVIAAVSARARTTHLGPEDHAASVAAAHLYLARWHRIEIVPSDLSEALDLVGRPSLALKYPDAIHLAVTRRLGLSLLTNDRQQHRAAVAIGLGSKLTSM